MTRPSSLDNSAASSDDTRARVVAAIMDGRLAEQIASFHAADARARGYDAQLVASMAEALRALAEMLERARDDLEGELSRGGVSFEAVPVARDRQLPMLCISVERRDVERAVAMAQQLGYESVGFLSRGASKAALRTQPEIRLVRPGDIDVRLSIRWRRDPASPVVRRLRPSNDDLAAISLPASVWFGYYVVRLVRLARRRLGWADRAAAGRSLGAYLSTPRALIPALLDAVDLTGEDILIDLGCGDGRIVVAAAQRGCRAVGFELDPWLVARARAAVTEHGVEDEVRIIEADSRLADVSTGTVVFLFLPPALVRDILPQVHASLPPGARIAAHEHLPLTVDPPADEVIPLAAGPAITNLHVWRL
jgi:hypothetical protein